MGTPRQESARAARELAPLFGRGLAEEVEEYFEHGAAVSRGDVVLDVGANVGAFAAAVAARTDGDVTLHCFEPAPPTFEQLRRNFRAHGALRRTRQRLHPVALSRPELDGQELTFYYFSRFPTDSTYDLERKQDEFEAFLAKKARQLEGVLGRFGSPGRVVGAAVRSTVVRYYRADNPVTSWLTWKVTGMRAYPCRLATLERIVDEERLERIDLLKIDVEGAELDVLRGCGAAWPKIRSVAIETDERGGRADEVVALLEAAGLRVTSRAAPAIAERGDAGQVLIVASR